MRKEILWAISGALVATVAFVAIAFFWANPFREGEITVAMPDGSSVRIKVANSNEISELIRNGLENKATANALTNSLQSIVENLPPGSTLGEKLVELAERRLAPFSWSAEPVKLVYDENVPPGMAAVCEHSKFLSRSIVVFVLGDNNEMLYNLPALYVDPRFAFPCPAGGESLHISSRDLAEFKQHKVLAKRTL